MDFVVSVSSFFLLIICMHFSNARLLPPAAAIVNPSSTANSISNLQVSEKVTKIGPPVTPSPNNEHGELSTQDKKTDHRGFKEGSEIVESSSSHDHVALLKGKHFKDKEMSSLPQYFEHEEVIDPRNDDDVVVMDYDLPRRKTPIHNK